MGLNHQLLINPALRYCSNPEGVSEILRSDEEHGDTDCVYLFARGYDQTIYVHFYFANKVQYCYTKVTERPDFIHLYLRGRHYNPFIKRTTEARTSGS